MNRYISSFLIAALLYTSLLGGIFYANELNPLSKSSKDISKTPDKVRIALVNPPKEVVEKPKKIEKKIVKEKIKKPPVKKIVEKKLVKKEPLKPKKTVVKKKIEKKTPKKIVKKAVEKKVVKKEPVKKVIEEVVEKISPQKIEEKVVEKKIQKKQEIVKKEVPEVLKKTISSKAIKKDKDIESKNIKREQSRYFTALQQRINENKNYPRRARVRSIEDDIKVEFTISKEGKLISFKIIEGSRLFHKATKRAIEDSFPFLPPKGIFSDITTVKLILAYRLY